MKSVLDCTIRDGGYHNNWNFGREFYLSYFEFLRSAPDVEFEIGYKKHPARIDNPMLGMPAFCNATFLKEIAEYHLPNLAWVMLDAKEVANLRIQIHDYLDDLRIAQEMMPGIAGIRIASSGETLKQAILLAQHIKKRGFLCCINIMRVHTENLETIHSYVDSIVQYNCVDRIYLADSQGIGTPLSVCQLFSHLTECYPDTIFGYHAHNNNGLALACSIEASRFKNVVCDCSLLGFGRGAGNTQTELLLPHLGLLTPYSSSLLYRLVQDDMPSLTARHQWGPTLASVECAKEELNQTELLEFIQPLQLTSCQKIQSLHLYKELKKNCTSLEPETVLTCPRQHDGQVLIVASGQSIQNHEIQKSLLSLIKVHKPLVLEINSVPFLQNVPERITCVNSLIRLSQVLALDPLPPKYYLTSSLQIYSILKLHLGPVGPNVLYSPPPDTAQASGTTHTVCMAIDHSVSVAPKGIWMAGVDGAETLISNFEIVQNTINLSRKTTTIKSLTPTRHDIPLQHVHSLV